MTTTEKLVELNEFRAHDGKAPFADWRNARHQPMLDAYREAAAEAIREEEVLAACGQDDGMAGASAVELVTPTAEKLPAYKVLANKSGKKSSLDNPVKFIHDWLNENPDVKRKQAVTTLVGLGVNYSTARTQYQRWFSGRK